MSTDRIRTKAEALEVAANIIVAQGNLIDALRTGTSIPATGALATVREQRPRFEAFLGAPKPTAVPR